MTGKSEKPSKRSITDAKTRRHSQRRASVDKHCPVYPDDDQDGNHHLKTCTRYPTFCFVCNQNYETTAASPEKYQASRTYVLAFCKSFNLSGEAEKEMLTLAGFSDPFCLNCCDKIFTLHNNTILLKKLMHAVQEVKSKLDELMVSSFPVSAHIGETHYIKERLVREMTSEHPAANQYEDNRNETLETDLVNDNLTPELQPALSSVNVEASVEDEIDDFHVDDGELEGSNVNDDDYVLPPKKKSRIRKSCQSTKRTKSSGRSGKGIRRNSKYEFMRADPSGQCHLCPNKFSTKFALSRHLKRKHSGIRYKCRHCDKSFQDTSTRVRHEFAVHIARAIGREFVCDQCGKTYFSGHILKEHIQVKHEGKIKKFNMYNPTPCEFCGKILSRRKTYCRHISLMHKPPAENRKIHPCPTCGKPFYVLQSLQRHVVSHLSLEERAIHDGITYFYKCKICPLKGQIGYKTRLALTEHFKSKHPNESATRTFHTIPPSKPRGRYSHYKIPCEGCPKRPHFKTEADLQAHVLAGHKRKRIKVAVNCDICGKPCPEAYEARQHRATHNPKCYFCSHCNERALHIKDMKAHYVESHPGVTPPPESLKILNLKVKSYFCPQCIGHPGFTTKKRLNEHIRNGHSFKKKECNSDAKEGLLPVRRSRPSRANVRSLTRSSTREHIPSSDKKSSWTGMARTSETEKKVKQEVFTQKMSQGGRLPSKPPSASTPRQKRTKSEKLSPVTCEDQEEGSRVNEVKEVTEVKRELKLQLTRLDLASLLKSVKSEVVF